MPDHLLPQQQYLHNVEPDEQRDAAELKEFLPSADEWASKFVTLPNFLAAASIEKQMLWDRISFLDERVRRLEVEMFDDGLIVIPKSRGDEWFHRGLKIKL